MGYGPKDMGLKLFFMGSLRVQVHLWPFRFEIPKEPRKVAEEFIKPLIESILKWSTPDEQTEVFTKKARLLLKHMGLSQNKEPSKWMVFLVFPMKPTPKGKPPKKEGTHPD